MSIGISEEHAELARSLREWAASLGGREAARDADSDAGATFADSWKACVEMGVATIGLPESYGGGGGSVLDQAVALEACAHELVPGPLLSTAVAALIAPCAEIGDGAAVALVHDSGLAGDLAGATHVLGADGLVALSGATPELGIDLTRRYGAVRSGTGRAGGPRAPHDRHARRRRGRRRRAVVPGDRGRLRQGARAVRPEDRRLPGDQAPVRRDARDLRGRHRRGLGRCRRVPRRCAQQRRGTVGLRRRRGRGDLLRRRRRGRQVVHPGARRHRLHLRARRAPLPAPRARAPGAGRRRRRGGPAVERTLGQRRTPPGGRRPGGPRQSGSPRGSGSGRADRGALRRRAPDRACRCRLPDAALAGAVRPRCRRRHPDRHRRGAGPGRGRPARHRDRGVGAADDRRARQRRAARAVRAAVPAWRARVVPALLRAGVGLRPGLAAHQGRAGRRRLEAHRPEGVDLGRAARRTGASVSRAPTPTRPSTRASPTSSST